MFSLSRLARAPLRRCLHTKAAAPTNVMGRRAALAIGASAVTASYITWQLTESNRTHCDAPQASSSKLKPNTTSTPPPTLAATSATEVDVFIPDAPSDPVVVAETTITSATPSQDATEASSEPPAEGESSGGGANMGAYNPETGEINWDCPCLGGMAHGPCGPEFKEAFSCFIYSEEEPKGINCVEKFQNMQNCFRAHPEVYADEIMRDEEDDEPAPAQAEGADAPTSETTSAEPTSSTKTDAAVAAAADS